MMIYNVEFDRISNAPVSELGKMEFCPISVYNKNISSEFYIVTVIQRGRKYFLV